MLHDVDIGLQKQSITTGAGRTEVYYDTGGLKNLQKVHTKRSN